MLRDETKFWLCQMGYIPAERITDTERLLDVFVSLSYGSRYAFDIDEDGLPDPMYESTDDNGATYLIFRNDISVLGEYSVDWYGKTGESIQSTVWKVETADKYGTSIDESLSSEPYLVIWKKPAQEAD